MKRDLLSIVVPVYNVREYLDQCIVSILHQAYPHIEVILVDDGSTDGSGEICMKYAQADKRVKLITQENQGVVRARKAGVAAAAGEYMVFVDADDYLDADFYQRLMACRDDFDLVTARWFREEEGHTRLAYDKIAPGAYRSQADMDFLLRHLINVSEPGGLVNVKSGIISYMMTKLYRTAMVKDVLETVNEALSWGEDQEFTYRYILKCRRVLMTDIAGYHYRIRRGSAAHTVDSGCAYLHNICRLYETLLPVFQADPRRDILLPQLQFKFSMLIARAPAKMGFPPEAQRRTIICPFLSLLEGKQIALYGAGEVGRSYLRQFSKLKGCTVALWVDENWQEYRREGNNVSPVEKLQDISCRYVVIASFYEEEAERIRQALRAMHIPEENILWSAPVVV